MLNWTIPVNLNPREQVPSTYDKSLENPKIKGYTRKPAFSTNSIETAAMTIQVECLACNGQYRIDANHAGKRIRCPGCQGVIAVPAAERKASPAPRAQQTETRQERPAPQRPAESRRKQSGAFAEPPVRPPRNPDRYNQTSGVPWKIMVGVAGAVVAFGVVGILIFNVLQSSGPNTTVASADPSVESNGDASGFNNNPGNSQSNSTENASANPTSKTATSSNSTFANGNVPIAANASNAAAGNQPSVAGNGAIGSSIGTNGSFGAAPVANVVSGTTADPSQPVSSAMNTGDASIPDPTTRPSTTTAISTILPVSETDLNIRDLFA